MGITPPVANATGPIVPEHHRCASKCPDCPFAGPKVGSKGNPRASIVFVAESPGYQEVRSRIPLSGPSGRIFHEFVPEATEDGDILILNALECCPPSGLKNEKSMNAGALACNPRLIEKIQEHPRRVIIALGNAAVRSLTGDYSLKITQIRGRFIPSPLAEMGIMPVIHVAALMRGTGSFRQWKEDINYALEIGYGGDFRDHIAAKVQIVPVTPRVGQREVDNIFETMTHLSPKVTCDIETSGLHYYARPHWIKNNKPLPQDPARILTIGVTPESDPSISYCFFPEHLPYLKRWLEDKDVKWAWHNGKFDIKFFRNLHGIQARVDDDTMLQSYALDEQGGVHDLGTISVDVLKAPDYKDMVQPYLPTKDTSYAEIPTPVLAQYQAYDTSNTAQIRTIYRERVRRDPDLEKLYSKTLLPASEMLSWVETNGIKIDMKRLEENEDFFRDMQDEARQKVRDLIGHDSFNPGSPQQVGALLFRGFKLPNLAKGSTGSDVLEKLREKAYPLAVRRKDPQPNESAQRAIDTITQILAYRKATKMYGTYVKGLRKWVSDDGRVHSTFKIHGTRTGRLASADPNMQNPPRLPQIRGSFIPEEGGLLMEQDLSQAELRCLAEVSKDPVLQGVYLANGDLHSDFARYHFDGWQARYDMPDGTDAHQQAYEERVKCKNVNFGIVYGVTPFGLYDQIGGPDTPLSLCIEIIDGWYDRYEVAGGFINKCRKTPANNQIITTCFGRKKRVGIVAGDNLKALQNEAANFPHQSIASDITLHTAILVWPQLAAWGVRIVNLIHDALLMEFPPNASLDLIEQTKNYVQDTFESIPRHWGLTTVPFKSDAEIGERWGSLGDFDKWQTSAIAA